MISNYVNKFAGYIALVAAILPSKEQDKNGELLDFYDKQMLEHRPLLR